MLSKVLFIAVGVLLGLWGFLFIFLSQSLSSVCLFLPIWVEFLFLLLLLLLYVQAVSKAEAPKIQIQYNTIQYIFTWGLRCLPWYVQVCGYMSFLAVVVLVFCMGGIWLAALVGVPGDLSWWVVSQKNIDSIFVAWLDLCWFSFFLF